MKDLRITFFFDGFEGKKNNKKNVFVKTKKNLLAKEVKENSERTRKRVITGLIFTLLECGSKWRQGSEVHQQLSASTRRA